ncbi:MAG TPA: HlyD family efflux transporter periplasmic adaptor subunit [Campylobacterales bacterium]|nr:HlyD family efflux transporter periplasmic adaptor subunit [Campylobacterales bacterium]
MTIMLVDTENLEIAVSISASMISKIYVGKRVPIDRPAIKYRTIGKIKAVIPDANPMTHKIQIRIEFDHRNRDIFPGMYAKVLIHDK